MMTRKRRYSLVLSLLVALAATVIFAVFYGGVGSTNKNAPPIFRAVDVTAYAAEASSATMTFNDVTYDKVLDEEGNETETPLTLSAAMALANAQDTSEEYPAVVTMAADATIDETLAVSGTIELDLNGYILKYTGASGAVIEVENSANFTLSSSGAANIIYYYYVDSDGLAVLTAYSNGVYNIKTGIIIGGKGYYDSGMSATYGGAVYVKNGGTFKMTGGALMGNTAYGGGAVYASPSSTVNISDGHILGNKATGNGGGIFNYGALTLNAAGIKYNTAGSSGGAIWLNSAGSNGTINIINNSILDNNIAKSGGALYALLGVITGGQFTARQNKAIDGKGGALYISAGCTVNLVADNNYRFILNQNTATEHGGAIYATDVSDFTLKWCDLSQNKAGCDSDGNSNKYGNGGAAAFENCSLDLFGIRVQSNEAYEGGGLYISGTKTGATDANQLGFSTLWNNRAHTNGGMGGEGGGGILLRDAKLNMYESCYVYGNICDGTSGNGGGIMLIKSQSGGSDTQLTFNGKEKVYNNSATGMDGGVYIVRGTFTMNEGDVIGGTPTVNIPVTSNGIGIAVAEYGYIYINGGEISNNAIGGIYNGGGAIAMCGGKIVDNGKGSNNGYGIRHVESNRSFTVSGAPVIKNNGQNGRQNVLLSGPCTITVGGRLQKGCDIRFSKFEYGGTFSTGLGRKFTTGYGLYNTASPGKYFTCETSLGAYALGLSSEPTVTEREMVIVPGRVKLEANGETTYHTDAEIAFYHVDDYDDLTEEAPAKITLPAATADDGMERVGETMEIHHGKHVVFELNGRLVKYVADEGSVIAVINNHNTNFVNAANRVYTSLTIKDSNPNNVKHRYTVGANGVYDFNDNLAEGGDGVGTIVGGVITGGKGAVNSIGNQYNGYGGAIVAGNFGASYSGGSIVKLEAGTIAGNAVLNNNGGGVALGYNSQFKMTGGSIEGNYAKYSGGGVYIYTNSTSNITAGEIKYNKSGTSGGGIYANVDVLNIVGTAKIHHNSSGNGGGIQLSCNNATIGGSVEIYENNAGDGCGIFMNGVSGSTNYNNNLTVTGIAKIYLNRGSTNSKSAVGVNGATLNIEGNAEINNNEGRGVYVNGTFNMSGGAIYDNEVYGHGGGVNFLGGTFTMTGGEIYNNTASSGHGGGVLTSGSLFEMQGGEIYNNNALMGGGVRAENAFTMKGGTIHHNVGTKGGGVYVYSSTSFTMENGTISDNTADLGGGIYTDSYVGDSLTGGTIKNNHATRVAGGLDNPEDIVGGGIYANNSRLTLGGTLEIVGNEALGGNGGGIALSTSSVSISGNVKILNNTAKSGGGIFRGPQVQGNGPSMSTIGGNAVIAGNTATEGLGGGVYYDCWDKGIVGLTICDSVVIGGEDDDDANIAATAGGGVYIGSNSQLTISAGESAYPTILGNMQGAQGSREASNLYLLSGKTVVIGSALTATAAPQIGVRMEARRGTFTTGYATTNASTAPSSFFVADEKATKSYDILSDEDDEAIVGNERVSVTFGKGENKVTKVYTDVETAFRVANKLDTTEDNPAIIKLGYQTGLGDEESAITLSVNSGKYIVLDLNGQILRHTGSGAVIQLNDGMLTIIDSDPSAPHRYTVNSDGLYEFDDSLLATVDGVETLYGGVITGGKNGGITIPNETIDYTPAIPFVLNLEEGTIAGNSCGGSGGGVRVHVFNMTGGAIRGNTANFGGGVYVCNNPKVEVETLFTLEGGEIHENRATSMGGGVCFNTADTNKCKMIGGSIHNNYAPHSGGGAFIKYATFEMSGGSIYKNSTGGTGGGIYTSENAVIKMSVAAEIRNNTAMTGGGVGNEGAKFIMTGGTIHHNEATGDGGGVYSTKIFELSSSAEISNNTSGGSGGGVHLFWTAAFTMTGGTISENTALVGGGIYTNTWAANTITGGTISGNTATYISTAAAHQNDNTGGGILANDSHLALGGDLQIIGNKALNGNGGGIALHMASFAISGSVEIRNNTAMNGGGIYRGNYGLNGHAYATNTIGGNAVIAGNTATEGLGGGVYFHGPTGIKLTITGGAVIGSNNNNENDANIATTAGGGVYIGDNKQLTISAVESAYPTILGNKQGAQDSRSASNLYLPSGKTVVIGSALTATAAPQIGVRMEARRGTFTTDYAKNNSATSPSKFFIADERPYDILTDENGEAVIGNERVSVTFGKGENKVTKVYTDVETAFRAANKLDTTDDNPAIIKLGYQEGLGDEEAADTLAVASISSSIAQFFILDLNGQILRYTGTNVFITIYRGMLTITDSSPDVVHKYTVNSDGLYVFDDTLDETAEGVKKLKGGVITGGKNSAITVPGFGGAPTFIPTLNLIKGTIAGNTASYGGGVDVYILNMTGGAICGNTASSGGGGVCISTGKYVSESSFTMTGGAIYENKVKGSSNGNGGGVYIEEKLADKALIQISGDAEIRNNTAYNGGGVYLCKDATLDFKNGNIYGNTAQEGGGVYFVANATVTMSGGNIYNNTAENKSSGNGGGVYVGTGTFTISGSAKIYNNTASSTGGGVITKGGTLNVNGGEIYGNTALLGGGISISGAGVLNMSDGRIYNNESDREVTTSSTYGGGIYLTGGYHNGVTYKANITGGMIYGNSAYYGGGIAATTTGTEACPIIIGEVTIAGNTATNGGGIYTRSYEMHISLATIGGAVMRTDKSLDGMEALNCGNYAADYGGGIYKVIGSLTISGGEISGNFAKNGGGGGIYSSQQATTINGTAKIHNNVANGTDGGGGLKGASQRDSEITIGGSAKIYNNIAKYSGGGVATSGGVTTIEDSAKIYGNIANKSGGGVYISNYATVNMTGGTIGGAVRRDESTRDGYSTLPDDADSVEYGNCAVPEEGGGVYIAQGTFNMSAGNICYNVSIANGGGGVFISSAKSSFKMSGGSIQYNVALGLGSSNDDAYGGGIGVYGDNTLELSGNVTILNNTYSGVSGNNGGEHTKSNIYVHSNYKIIIADALTAASEPKIGVTTANLNVAFTTGYNDAHSDVTPTTFFLSDNPLYEVLLDGNGEVALGGVEAIVTFDNGTTKFMNVTDAFVYANRLATSSTAYATVTILANVTVSKADSATYAVHIESGKFIIFDLDGFVLTALHTALNVYDIFDVDGTFEITDGSPDKENTLAVSSGNNKTFIGGVIRHAASAAGVSVGRAVNVHSGGSLKITGGTITECRDSSAEGGGAVRVDCGTFTMTKGAITGNSASYGGGVYATGLFYGNTLHGSSTVKLYGTALISENTATNGGGIYLINSSLSLEGNALISENSATFGAGIYSPNDRWAGARIDIKSGAISKNNASRDGGGIHLAQATFSMTGGSIKGNSAGECGGGIYFDRNDDYTFEIDGGVIGGENSEDANTANKGGGIFMGSSNIRLKSGKISGNRALDCGGGIHVNFGDLYLEGGEISGNNAVNDGGALYGDSVHLSATSVTDNTSKLVSGGVVSTTAKRVGGIICKSIEISGGVVKNNKNADSNAATNLYVPEGKISVSAVLAEDTDIGITYPAGGIFTTGYTTNGNTLRPSKYFKSDNPNYLVGLVDGEAALGIAKVTVSLDDDPTGFLSVEDAFEYANTLETTDVKRAVITILEDVSASEELVIVTGKAAKLDLNGKVLSAVDTSEFSATEILQVYGKLEIVDSNPTVSRDFTTDNAPEALTVTGGIITHFKKTDMGTGRGAVVKNGGVLEMTKGTIIWNCATRGNDGSGVKVERGGTFTMTGGVIAGGFSKSAVFIESGATFTLNGGTIKDNSVAGEYPIGAVKSAGTFDFVSGSIYAASGTLLAVNGGITTMTGGEIYNTDSSNGSKGAVAVYGGTFNMSAGKIHGHIDTSWQSGGVYIASGGKFEMSGTAEIYENGCGGSVGGKGGGVLVDSGGEFEMSGGVIRKNVAGGTGSMGGGVYVAGRFKLTGGTIGGEADVNANTAKYGGGVYVASSGIFEMTGGTVARNKADFNGGGIYATSATITLTQGVISNNSAHNGGGIALVGVTASIGKNIVVSGNKGIKKNDVGAVGGGIYVSGGTVGISCTVTDANSATLGSGVGIDNGGTVTLNDDCVISGNYFYGGFGFGVYVEGENSSLIMDGGQITNNKNSSNANGGGVYVGLGASFTMNGGSIDNNEVNSYGGGVYVSDGAESFTMNGGTISDNKAGIGGGIAAYSKVTIGKDAVIDNNEATYSDGGGIYATNSTSTSFDLTLNGTISNNKATSGGGGAYVSGKIKVAIGGSFVDNEAKGGIDGGGGIRLSSGMSEKPTVTMSSGSSFSGNSANGGGAIYLVAGTFSMVGGSISNNTSTTTYYGGGAIRVGYDGEFTMSGGTLSGNTALGGNGGGVYIDENGKFNLLGGEIESNTAVNGGGVYVSANGQLTVKGAIIVYDNKTASNAVSNVYISDSTASTKIAVEELQPTAVIGISVHPNYYTGAQEKIISNGYGENNDDGVKVINPTNYFRSDIEGVIVKLDPSGKEIVLGGPSAINLADIDTFKWTLKDYDTELLDGDIYVYMVSGKEAYYFSEQPNLGTMVRKIETTGSIVRYRNTELTINLNNGEDDDGISTIVYADNTKKEIGTYTSTATLTLKNTDYMYVSNNLNDDRRMTIEILDGGRKAVITKTWYIVYIGNDLLSQLVGPSYGGDYKLPTFTFNASVDGLVAPRLQHGDEGAYGSAYTFTEDDNRVTFTLWRYNEQTGANVQIGTTFNRYAFGNYINNSMPVGEYTLRVSVQSITIAEGNHEHWFDGTSGTESDSDLAFPAFTRNFGFEVKKNMNANANIVDDIKGEIFERTYNGMMELLPAGTALPTFNSLARVGEWLKTDYDSYYASEIAFNIDKWNSNSFVSEQTIRAYENNRKPVNAGTYKVYYRVRSNNYDGTYGGNTSGSVYFTIKINKQKFDVKKLSFKDAEFDYDGEKHYIYVEGVPDDIVVNYTPNGKINADTYEVTATFDVGGNYEDIDPMTAILKINKATFNAAAWFKDAEVLYDGNEHSITIDPEKIPKGITVEYDGNGQTEAGPHPITAKFTVNSNYNVIDDITVTLTITKASYNTDDLLFAGITVTYTGESYSIYVTGLPEGVTVEYKGNGVVNAGTHDVTAKFTVDSNHMPIADITKQIIINKATFDPTGLFTDKTFEYDGNEHSITIDPEKIPKGITVEYVGNGQINVETYTVTAKFTVNGNYHAVSPVTAQLTITKGTFDAKILFENMTVEYDGNEHSIFVSNLPDGITVEYEGNGVKAVGTHTVTAKFTVNENFNDIADKTATLTINKAKYNINAITFNDITVVYDGESHSVYVNGLPSGVTVEYDGNGVTEIGTYTVTAKFTVDGNHEPIADMTAKITITDSSVINPPTPSGGGSSRSSSGGIPWWLWLLIALILLAILIIIIIIIVVKRKKDKEKEDTPEYR